MQQKLYRTPLGSLVCAHCEAPAVGSGREDDPFVILHAEECDFVRGMAPPRAPGRHRASAAA